MAARDDIVLWGGASGLDGWSAHAAPASRVDLAVEAGALRFAYAFGGPGSFAIARRALAAALPAHYVAVLRIRGEGPPVELQVKLVGAGGADVWWWRLPAFEPPAASAELVFRRARLEFAWGPASGGEPRHLEAVELAVAGEGGEAVLWVESLRIEARAPTAALPRTPSIRASSERAGYEAHRALEPDPRSAWRPASAAPGAWLELDLGRSTEWGGLAVDFADREPPATRLLGSGDGVHWRLLAEAPAGGPARQWLRTADGEGRFLRLELDGPTPFGVTRVACVPLELAVAPARHAAALARAAPRGAYPRHLLGEPVTWALVAADGDPRKALLGADGALEIDAGACSIEPFLWSDGTPASWHEAQPRPFLLEDRLPIPGVAWSALGLGLEVTAFAIGSAGASAIVIRYALENRSGALRTARLLLAIRPFQVTPAWQSLNLPGGGAFAPIVRVARSARGARVNGALEIAAITPPDGFGATPSDASPLADFLARGEVPARDAAEDPLGFAEAAFAFDAALAPGERALFVLAIPLHATTPALPVPGSRAEAARWVDARLAESTGAWRARLARLPIELPPVAARFESTLGASLGWILLNREGPRIQPGPRCYRRSWIRDGALTAAALAEQGFGEEAREFLRWYAPHQLPDGRVPCAVDRRGVDHTVEHDSHGQLVFGIVEVFRLTGDRGFLAALWPHALRAVGALEVLLAERHAEAYRDDPRFGLLPESISHEGYASQPVHAYWDDFFALRALCDAAVAAGWLGDAGSAARIGALRDRLRADLGRSIARTIARHRIDFLPGSVELGDFDPTSSAIALDPCGARDVLPEDALARTFARFSEELEHRRSTPPEAYSAYEVRNAAALLRLDAKERALALLERLVADQRPPGWCQWPEVSWREDLPGRFLGDLPHGWVASSFLRAVRSLLAYERREDDALVLCAGLPEPWLESPGVHLRALPTHYGALDATIAAEGPDEVVLRFGSPLRPPGGVVVESPRARPLREAHADGRAQPLRGARRVELAVLPRELRLGY